MHAAIESIIIQGQPPRLPNLVAGLAVQGWSVRSCTTTAALTGMVEVCAPQVVVIENGEYDLRTLVSVARYTSPNAALIALISDPGVDARVAALDAGADACCLLSTDLREVCALGRALVRSRNGPSARAPREASLWRLTHAGRVLAGPSGQRLPLTFTESAFFLRLLSSPGHRLPRERLIATAVAGPRGPHSARSVDVMVSRLRAKAERLGVGLPLLAVRQWGYIFLTDTATEAKPLEDVPVPASAGYCS